jgi:heat shock protein HslJ
MEKNICNNFFGPFKADAGTMEIDEIGSTRMMCEGMQLENIIFKMLRDMKTWSIQSNRLTLRSANQLDRLEFYKP